MPTLEIHQLSASEVYRDIVRVNEAHRTDKRMERIKEGRVCLVRANGRECLAILRGYRDSADPEIRMDDYTRGAGQIKPEIESIILIRIHTGALLGHVALGVERERDGLSGRISNSHHQLPHGSNCIGLGRRLALCLVSCAQLHSCHG